MSNDNIKSALWSAKRTIKSKLSDLDENATDIRSSLRYHQSSVRRYKENLDAINRRKRVLRHELKKAEALEYGINPIKNIQNAKGATSND